MYPRRRVEVVGWAGGGDAKLSPAWVSCGVPQSAGRVGARWYASAIGPVPPPGEDQRQMQLLTASVNAAVVAAVGILLAWLARGRFEAIDRRFDRLEERFDIRM